LKRFTLPEATPEKRGCSLARPSRARHRRDNLILNDNNLGRLELVAVNQALDWNIEKLVLTGPEALSPSKGACGKAGRCNRTST